MQHVPPTASYDKRRDELETYFDRTAFEAWTRLTSDVPVSGIRATVRAGRDRMRSMLLSWLPMDMTGLRLLDAGCGTGALAVEAARRGADVVAIDLSANLVDIARTRTNELITGMAAVGETALRGRIEYLAGDMLDPALGHFDHIVGMDSLIHYRANDMIRVITGFAERTNRSLLFTYAPRTPALAVMRAVGRLIPTGDRAPWIEPVGTLALSGLIKRAPALSHIRIGRTERISSGFYKSQALELVRREGTAS
jgi:magnesium-protoporphyrin O-methyltransferase